MRVLAAIVLVALGTACGAAAQQESSEARKARVEIVRTAPLTIRGAGFEPGERVRLLATGGGVETRRVAATAAGSFTAKFGLKGGRCTALVVQAFGNKGSRATIDRPTLDCIEP